MFLGGIGILKLLQTFWGLAVLAGLGGYSFYQTMQPSNGAESPSRDARLEVAQLLPNQPPTPYSTPFGGYPTPAPLTIFLACDGTDADAVRYYVPAPGGSVSLRVDVDRDLVVALLREEPTRFGASPNLVQTPCIRGHIRAGRLP